MPQGFAAPRPYWRDPNDRANWQYLSSWLNDQVIRTEDFTFQTGFTNYGGGFEDVSVLLTRDGLVFLEGMVVKSSASVLDHVLTLDEQYAPLETQVFLAATNLTGSGVTRVDVRNNGEVLIKPSTGSTGWVSLSGIVYSAA